MKSTVGSLREAFRRAYHALAYAHCGEMLSLNAKSDALGTYEHNPMPARCETVRHSARLPLQRKCVVLAFDSDLHCGAMRYAVEAAERLDAELDIICKLAGSEINDRMQQELGRIYTDRRILPLQTDLMTAIADHTARNNDVLFVVTSDDGSGPDHFAANHAADRRIHAPWLVIPEQQRAA